MAYYFMVEEKKGKYKEINLNNVYGFDGSKKYHKLGAYGLDEIDNFTMMFDDEVELRKALLSSGRLTKENACKPLSIRWKTPKNFDKVLYDFLYQKDIDYVFDPLKVLKLVTDRYRFNDLEFVRKLAAHFRNYYVCSTTASEICLYVGETIKFNVGNKYLDMRDENGDILVSRLVKLLIFKHSTNGSGRVCYSREIDYRNLHEIIAFINNYDQQIGTVESRKKITLEDLIEESKISYSSKKTTGKVRVRKREELEGQLSFLDMFDDGV